MPSSSSGNFPFSRRYLSQSILISGAQIPVRMKAAATPSAASTPNERRAAISEVKFAANADMVVNDVSIIALPTLDREA